MNKNKAYQILNCEHFDDVQDAYLDKLFDFKSKFLQQIPPLKLIDAIELKISKINEAYSCFHNLEVVDNVKLIPMKIDFKLKEFLDYYQKNLAQIRLEIANTNHGLELLDLINQLKTLQTNLFLKLSQYTDLSDAELEKYPIKLSQEIDVFAMQINLKHLNLEDAKISEYIRTQITDNNFELFSAITKAVINAKKQIKFNELRREI